MTSHRTDGKLPNIGGWRTPHPLHSAGYRVERRIRSITAAALVAVLAFIGTAVGATWFEFNSLVKQHGVSICPLYPSDASDQ